MELLTVILLLVNTTVLIMGLRQLRKSLSAEKPVTKKKSKKVDVERKKSEELREKHMQNFLSYTGDKQ